MEDEQLSEFSKIGFNFQYAYENQGIFVFEVKLSRSTTEYIINFLMYHLNNPLQKLSNIVYLASKKRRAEELFTIAKKSALSDDTEITKDNQNLMGKKNFIITTLENYIDKIFDKDHTDRQENKIVVVESFDVIEEFNEILSGEITDTYIRRAFIEIYKLNKKIKGQAIRTINVDEGEDKKTENGNVQIEKKQRQKIENLFGQGKKLIQTNKNKSSGYFSNFSSVENLLISLSLMSYILGYFQKTQDLITRSRQVYEKNGEQFLNDFENKTLISRKVVRKMEKNLRVLEKMFPDSSMSYIFEICSFLKKVILCEETFGETYKKFVIKIEKVQKDVFKSPDLTEATYYLRYKCEDETIVLDLLKSYTKSLCLVQNFWYPKRLFSEIFRNKIKVKTPIIYKTDSHNLYALNISTTPSKQDLTLRASDVQAQYFQQIIRSFGVCINELAANISDGMVVFFPSHGLITKCRKEWNSEQKIYQKLNANKRVFIEKETEKQNFEQIKKFKKYCDNGSGAIFFLSFGSQTAKYQNFYSHYSRCIIFLGYPIDPQKKIKDFKDKQQNAQRKINECLNHCINDLKQRKGIVFLGRDFLDLKLGEWFKFIKNEDCITFEGVDEMRKSYQLPLVHSK